MKTVARQNRHRRIRAHLSGTAERPRLVVFRGTKTMSAQLIDDTKPATLLTVTTAGKKPVKLSAETATKLGEDLAKRAAAKKVKQVVFDRAGYAYHGAVKALADGARKGGLKL